MIGISACGKRGLGDAPIHFTGQAIRRHSGSRCKERSPDPSSREVAVAMDFALGAAEVRHV
jgi:hypothetical protein